MLNSPCHKCEQRKLGCHSTCSKYITYFEANEERKKLIAKNRKTDRMMTGYVQSKRYKLELDSPFF